ncbi:unnamed protein product [Peniophora sp. CBMAI 1063]|nr:unnamed protein product [Peniophora sp. CBMAI 1063]
MPGPEEAGPSRPTKRKRREATPPVRRPPSKRAPASQTRPETTCEVPSIAILAVTSHPFTTLDTSLPKVAEVLETEDLLPTESSPDDGDEDADTDEDDRDRKVPVRMLNEFCVFEEYEGRRVIQSLEDYSRTRLQAVGTATPYFSDADAGNDEDVADGAVYLRTTRIRDIYVQYLEYDRLIWIKTEHAWYVLCEANAEYRQQYTTFANKQFSLQLLCSMAAHPQVTLQEYYDALEREVLGRECRESDLHDFMNLLNQFAREEGQSFLHIPLIHAVRKECGFLDDEMLLPSSAPRVPKRRPIVYKGSPRNLDEHVLRHDQLTSTCVTPFVDRLRQKYHPSWAVDSTVVHWERDEDDLPKPTAQRKAAEHQHLLACVRRARDDVDDEVRVLRRNSEGDVIAVRVGSEIYSIGDVVVFFPTSSWNGKKPDPLPKKDRDIVVGTRLEDLVFWFARLVSIEEPPPPKKSKSKSKGKPKSKSSGSEQIMGHVVWFEHASRTFVGEEADPRELVLWPRQCDDQPLAAIHGKVGVHMMYESGVVADLPADCSYFCRFEYTEGLGYRSIPPPPPFDIPVCTNCSSKGTRELDDEDIPLKVGLGFRMHGQLYHADDCCLFYTSDEPGFPGSLGLARIGQIMFLNVETDSLELREFGRIADFAAHFGDARVERSWDAQQLFVGPIVQVHPKDVVGSCKVLHRDAIPGGDIGSYVSASSTNFWVRYKSWDESLDIASADELEELDPSDVPPCSNGCAESRADRESNHEVFCGMSQGRKCLDICAGAGLLGAGLSEGSKGIYDVTHAVEIRPSAAQTIRNTHPRTKVYMTCMNTLLESSVKWHNGDQSAYDGLTATDGSGLPDTPPQPMDKIDTVVGGIPCQSHSSLNAFKRQKDKKTDLMLSFLSWIHFIRPNRIILENVKGFMDFAVDGVPLDPKKCRGSGLRFLVNVLMRLGYQVQFCLLNAVHYGTPQRRVRFILFAAKIGFPLMHAPKPTHYHPSEAANLTYSHLNAEGQDVKLSALEARQYRVPLRYISVWDAISDLIPWDLESTDPRVEKHRAEDQEDLIELREHLVSLCGEIFEYPQLNIKDGMIGPQVEMFSTLNSYLGSPRSTFQEAMRPKDKEVRALQHYSVTIGRPMTQLVRLVPLVPRADWQDIPRDLVERFADPSRRKKDWKRGTIGRIDKDGVFQTIVTNVHPLAKQGWVLHPVCRRILTVRELARAQGIPDWYHIYAPVDPDHNVITRAGVIEMHRQIGNAVPLPLATAIGRALLEAEFEPWYALSYEERMAVLGMGIDD